MEHTFKDNSGVTKYINSRNIFVALKGKGQNKLSKLFL